MANVRNIEGASARRGVSAIAEWVGMAKSIALALLIALALRVLLFQPFIIPSPSMEPALREGDYVVVSKYAYGWSRHSIPLSPPLFSGRLLAREPRRGDVVVFKLPRDGRTDYVKRLIGLPGDRIQVLRGAVWINGRPVDRERLAATWDPANPARDVIQMRETLPNGRRYLTFAEPGEHDGQTTGVYVVPHGQYFFMGDNRDNSADSRWPEDIGVGFVPAENLVGRAELVVLSWRDGFSVWRPWSLVTRLDFSRFLLKLG